ncbi:sensor histidine kinase [Sphaerisporangium sp. NPDC051017]|uniref:sensor histidine kinase n=1 Tax=Sphaerisporangium sp. NPDC051017 TaxID=3154636 RepID=UPI00342F6978
MTSRLSRGDAWAAFRSWEIFYLVVFVVTAGIVATDGGPSPAAKGTALALLGACAVAYFVVGRAATMSDEPNPREGVIYSVLIVAAFVPAATMVHAAGFALFALCPQVFMMLRSRWAVVVVIFLNVLPAVRLLSPELSVGEAIGSAAFSVVSVAFSLVFGPWVSRIIRQSAERAELIEELRASRAQVERLSRERGALAERQRLAGEIHDTLAQGFTSIIMLIQAAEAQADPSHHLALAVRTARENLEEARGLIAALTPAPLDGSTLEEALGRIASRLGEELGVPVTFTAEGASRPLPPGAEVVLIRAAQEALANVRRHATASSAHVTLEYGEHEVVLRVADDGVGFHPGAGTPEPAPEAQGYGLRAMRTRVEQAGGTLEIASAPGKGTELTVRLPQEETPA